MVPMTVDKTKDVPTTLGRVLMAAGADRPTAFMANANAGRAWAKELLASALNPFGSLMMRPRKSPINFIAQRVFKAKATIASGNRNSTTLHRLGTKTNPTMNNPLIDIATAKGAANRVDCALDVINAA